MSLISSVLRSISGKMSTDQDIKKGVGNVDLRSLQKFTCRIIKPLIQSNYPSSYHSKILESPYLLYFTAAILAPLSQLSCLFAEKR